MTEPYELIERLQAEVAELERQKENIQLVRDDLRRRHTALVDGLRQLADEWEQRGNDTPLLSNPDIYEAYMNCSGELRDLLGDEE